MISLVIWSIVQIFILAISCWFVVYGIRAWNQRRFLAVIVLFFGFAGIYDVIETLWSAGLF